MVRAVKEDREIRTGDRELKAIHAILKALEGLDTQAAGRVLTFCIDRTRQEHEAKMQAAAPATVGERGQIPDRPPAPRLTFDELEPVGA